jgi:formylmethanofuran dehydrogenase subunit E
MENKEEDQWLACVPVKEGYKPKLASGKASCEKCGVQVWQATSSPKGMRIICMDCLQKQMEMEDIEVMPPTKKQMDDML